MPFIIFFLFISIGLFAQEDISGFWIARSEKNPYYGIMYLKKKSHGKIEGITYDKTLSGFCSFLLVGYYKPSKKLFVAKNNQLVKKSPPHMAGIYHLNYSKANGKEFLIGNWRHNTQLLINTEENKGIKKPLILHILYERPTFTELNDGKKIPYILDYLNSKKTAIKNSQSDNTEIPEEQFKQIIKKRENKIIHSIRTQSNEILIQIRDYDKEDGDKISILIDGQLFRYNKLLRSSMVQLKIPLNKGRKTSLLCFAANNLGTIPPNTAIFTLFVDGKKIEKTLLTNESITNCIEIKK